MTILHFFILTYLLVIRVTFLSWFIIFIAAKYSIKNLFLGIHLCLFAYFFRLLMTFFFHFDFAHLLGHIFTFLFRFDTTNLFRLFMTHFHEVFTFYAWFVMAVSNVFEFIMNLFRILVVCLAFHSISIIMS